ncbi:hypothetical protein D3C74_316460 [compost metagenome]
MPDDVAHPGSTGAGCVDGGPLDGVTAGSVTDGRASGGVPCRGPRDGRGPRGRRAETQARCPGEQLGPQVVRLVELEEAELDARVRAPRDLELELGEPEQPRDERLDDVDGLEAVEARLALLPEQDARVQADRLVVDRVGRHAPRQGRVAQADQADHEDRAQDLPPAVAGQHVLPLGEPLEGAVADDDEQDRDHGPPTDHRGHGVDAVPGQVGRRRLGRSAALGHSPANRASPRDARRSRRRSASAGSSPSIDASVAGDAVCSWTCAIRSLRASGPACTSTYCMRP